MHANSNVVSQCSLEAHCVYIICMYMRMYSSMLRLSFIYTGDVSYSVHACMYINTCFFGSVAEYKSSSSLCRSWSRAKLSSGVCSGSEVVLK